MHRGTDIKCPFCCSNFTTATGLVHHLERGSCPYASDLNRDEIYRFVRSKDPNGLISKKLIGWKGESNVTYQVSGRAWNGDAWECYFCHRGFGTATSLEQHLNSNARMSASNYLNLNTT